jgi:hypothetical protein
MDMTKDNNYNNYLQKDLKHGTHVAYLHYKTDKTISHPIARIALKPWLPSSPSGEKPVLRPESITYGHGSKDFSHSVKKWAHENFPVKENVVYKKSKHIYDDDGNNEGHLNTPELKHTNNAELFHKNSLKDIEDASEKLKPLPVHYKDYKEIEPALTSAHFGVISHIVENAPKEELHHLAHSKNLNVQRLAPLRYDEMSDESKKHLLNTNDVNVHRRIAQNTKDRPTLAKLAASRHDSLAKTAAIKYAHRFPEYAKVHKNPKIRMAHLNLTTRSEKTDRMHHLNDKNSEIRERAQHMIDRDY